MAAPKECSAYLDQKPRIQPFFFPWSKAREPENLLLARTVLLAGVVGLFFLLVGIKKARARRIPVELIGDAGIGMMRGAPGRGREWNAGAIIAADYAATAPVSVGGAYVAFEPFLAYRTAAGAQVKKTLRWHHTEYSVA